MKSLWKQKVEQLLGISNDEGDQEFDEETLAQKTGYSAKDLVKKGDSLYGRIKHGPNKGKLRRLAKNVKSNEDERKAIARIEGHAQHPEKYAEDIENEDGILIEHIVHKKDGWHVMSKDYSKHLGGPYSSKEQALKRLRQVEFFKHH